MIEATPICPQYRFTVPVAQLNHVTACHRSLLMEDGVRPDTLPLPLPVVLAPPGQPVPRIPFGVIEDVAIGSGRLWASGVLHSQDDIALRDWVGALRLGSAAFALDLDQTESQTINAGDRQIRVFTHWRLTGLTVRLGAPIWTAPGDIDIKPMTSMERRTWHPKTRETEPR
ncbi:hypothetical protein [Streptomyces violaceusniger]|uniref:Uncharacterized protein n=1 Tax=Streptomyces violaceusniger (strain Tu 4113) TaxID=653045 RepID=G2PHU5_STRV4|nr:hypothetical protein [Streptomyces violaceusniger]AEM88896.1 hypothetical protein Strvi_0120 [Streptomyces violaceusniger Tu 4113]